MGDRRAGPQSCQDLVRHAGIDTDQAERVAARLLNNDRITNPANVAYKEWHAARRRERRERGVWRAGERASQLWALD